jgi:hypothetical protein
MKIIFAILAIIVAAVAILLILALFLKKKYTIERSVIIRKPKNEVFDFLRLLRNQDKFSKWATLDHNMHQVFKGIDGTIGFVSAWDSEMKNVGKGEQEIANIIDGQQIEYRIHFIRPFESLANAYLTTEKVSDNQTRVIWGFKSKMKYPMNLMMLIMNMDQMVGNDLDTGLQNLKSLLEK